MGTHSDGLSLLTARHGCKCMPDESITVEDVFNAIGVDLGASNILSASRMNKAIVVFLKEESMVDDLVERGLSVGNVFVSVLPLSNLAKKVMLSNVPPFISNDSLERLLVRYGKLVGPIKMIPLGLKNPDLKHIMSFRRQTHMVLNADCQSLNVSAKMTVQGKGYTIFISTESMKCFNCARYGHIKQACPLLVEAVSVVENGDEPANIQQVTPATENHSVGESISENNEDLEQVPMMTLSGDRDHQIESESLSKVSANEQSVETLLHVGVVNDPVIVTAGENELGVPDGQIRVAGETQMLVENLSQNITDTPLEPELGESQPVDDDSTDSATSDETGVTEMNSQGNAEGKASVFKLKSYYSVQQINNFLDATFNQRRPKLEAFFPDLQLFVESVAVAMRKATLEEIDQPKRYRLKKYMSTVRQKLKICHKK